jgi:hypothetical protein
MTLAHMTPRSKTDCPSVGTIHVPACLVTNGLVSYKPTNIIVLAGLIVMVMHFLHAGRKRETLPGTEEPMTASITASATWAR